MVSENFPGLGALLINHENRLNQIEHEVGILQGRMPKSKARRVFWWACSMFWLAVPIAGGLASLRGEDPWKQPVVFAAFGVLIGKAASSLVTTVARGPRPHKSLLVDDHR